MKIIYNNLIPFPGYSAMMLCGIIFARKKYKPLPAYVVNHEKIHRAQAREAGGYLRFYLMYLGQWIKYGYRNAPFECEAYENSNNPDYLLYRPRNVWKIYRK